MNKEVKGNKIKEVVMNDIASDIIIEEATSGFIAKYRIFKMFNDKWEVKVFFYGKYELLGYFDKLRVLELIKYSKFKYSDKEVALFQHLLNIIDTTPLFLKVYEEKGVKSNASTLSY